MRTCSRYFITYEQFQSHVYKTFTSLQRLFPELDFFFPLGIKISIEYTILMMCSDIVDQYNEGYLGIVQPWFIAKENAYLLDLAKFITLTRIFNYCFFYSFFSFSLIGSESTSRCLSKLS